MPEQFDAIVIGAGEAGTIVASQAVEAGFNVAMIYLPPFGSTCLNSGCVPSKFLIHRARIAHLARTAARFHVHTSEPQVDLKAMVDEKNADIIEHREESLQSARSAEGLTLIEGQTKFVSEREILTAGRTLRAEKIFIATGMRPLIPKIDGIEEVPILTNETIMDLREIPQHLVVIGGGYIGCELGQAFHRFGSRVTMIHKWDHLVPEEDPDVSTILERAFETEGITVLLKHEAVRMEKVANGFRVFARSKEHVQRTIDGTHLFVAAGRQPNSDLDLDKAGIEIDRLGFVKVDDYLETNISRIWAIGDINGQQPFTRVCQEEGKVAFANAFEGKHIKMERQYLGHAIFTDPEIGSVGLTIRQAHEKNLDAPTGLVMFDQISKAKLIGETTGLIKYVFDRSSHQLLGCHVIGPSAAELVYDSIVVMRHGGTIDEIARAVGIFPTLQEGIEGTARALLRKVAPQEVSGPLVTGSVHHEGPCFSTKRAA